MRAATTSQLRVRARAAGTACAIALIASVTALIGLADVVAAAGWADYRPSSLTAIAAEHRDCNTPPVELHIESGSWKYTVHAAATGEMRALSPESGAFIRGWAKSVGHGPEVVALFTHEVEVRDGDAVYWLPIQESLTPPYRDEVGSGTEVELKVLLAGAAGSRWIFLVNSFQAQPEGRPAER